MLAEIQPGLATPMAGVRWLGEVVWDDPYTGPVPAFVETGTIPLVAASERAVLDAPQRPAGSIWDALDETAGIPVLTRAALWRRDAVERRTAAQEERGAISA